MLIEYCKKMDPKKFNKFLIHYNMKGLLKLCNTYKEADFVLLYDTEDYKRSTFISKTYYEQLNPNNIAEKERLCFVKHSNPRNKQSLILRLTQFEQSRLTNK